MCHPSVATSVLALFSIATLGACDDTREARASATGVEDYVVAQPAVREVVIEQAYVADVRAARHAEIRARIGGVIESVAIDEGQTVKAGQLLFTINARARSQAVTAAQAGREGAAAELRAAELELTNTQLLRESDIVSAAELDRAQAKVDVQRARVSASSATLARSSVELAYARAKAPFAGVINRIPYRAGSAIADGQLLTTVSDASEVIAYFALSEREYLAQRGEKHEPAEIVLTLADGSVYPHPGRIDAVGSEFDADAGTITYRARFANPDGILKHGSSGKIVLRTRMPTALTVPLRSVFEIQGDHYVYTVDDAGVAHQRKLALDVRSGDVWVVSGGVTAADRFVVEGAQRLRDGAKVNAVTATVRPAAGR